MLSNPTAAQEERSGETARDGHAGRVDNRASSNSTEPSSSTTKPWWESIGNSISPLISDDIRLPLFLVACLIFVLAAYFLREVLIPFTIGILLTYLLRPVVQVLEENLTFIFTCCNAECCKRAKKRVSQWRQSACSSKKKSKEEAPLKGEKDDMSPIVGADSVANPSNASDSAGFTLSRLISVVIATLLLVGVMAIVVLIVADSLQSFQEAYMDVFTKQFEITARKLVDWLKKNLRIDASSLLSAFDTLAKEFASASTLMGIANALMTVLLTLLFTMFLLLDRRFDRGYNPKSRRSAAFQAIDAAIHRYIVAKTFISALMGLLVYLVLGPILHVKLAHLFGVLTFFLNFIPNVGAVIAAVVPLPVILLDPELSTGAQVMAILLPLAIHTILGNFVEPLVLGPLLSLHPVIVLLCLGIWYVLWGVAGAILAVPITSVVAIAVKHSQHSYAQFIVGMLERCQVDMQLLQHFQSPPQARGSEIVSGKEVWVDMPAALATPAVQLRQRNAPSGQASA